MGHLTDLDGYEATLAMTTIGVVHVEIVGPAQFLDVGDDYLVVVDRAVARPTVLMDNRCTCGTPSIRRLGRDARLDTDEHDRA